MKRIIRSGLAGLIAGVAGLVPLAGCDSTGHARFTPSRDEARSSLEAALTAWRDGRPFGPIEATPPVRVADSLWQGGRQIEAFQVGDEEDPGDGTKQFPVKLTMKKSHQVQDVRYVVNGRDPVWVYNELDFKRMIGMDNGPEPARSRPGPGRARGR